MNMMPVLRMKNRVVGSFFPGKVAKDNARLFLSPRRFPVKAWEAQAEQAGQRLVFGASEQLELSALRWGSGSRKVLLMHGWESRATQMYELAKALVENGFEVIAIDAPGHGGSKAGQANPVTFAKAVKAACQELGPFEGAIGHSMGCAGLAIAREQGALIPRYALISSPANMLDRLLAFCDFMGLPQKSRRQFVGEVSRLAGRPAEELDVGGMLATGDPEMLLVHASDDLEVPYSDMERISQQLTRKKTWTSHTLGHRRIVRDPGVANVVQQFFCSVDTELSRKTGQGLSD